jgi:hypothetical protein
MEDRREMHLLSIRAMISSARAALQSDDLADARDRVRQCGDAVVRYERDGDWMLSRLVIHRAGVLDQASPEYLEEQLSLLEDMVGVLSEPPVLVARLRDCTAGAHAALRSHDLPDARERFRTCEVAVEQYTRDDYLLFGHTTAFWAQASREQLGQQLELIKMRSDEFERASRMLASRQEERLARVNDGAAKADRALRSGELLVANDQIHQCEILLEPYR